MPAHATTRHQRSGKERVAMEGATTADSWLLALTMANRIQTPRASAVIRIEVAARAAV
jgi:hypothetical protein